MVEWKIRNSASGARFPDLGVSLERLRAVAGLQDAIRAVRKQRHYEPAGPDAPIVSDAVLLRLLRERAAELDAAIEEFQANGGQRP